MFRENEFFYDFRMAFLSLIKTPVLSALMVVSIGIGIGAFMTMITLYVVMTGDPIPEESDQLYTYALDNRLLKYDEATDEQPLEENPPAMVSYQDATNLMKSDIPSQQAVFYSNWSVYSKIENKVYPFWDITRLTTPNFFSIFDVPFLYGGPWSQQQEDEQAFVIVLPKAMNEKLFGGKNSIGERIKLDDNFYEVVGVTDVFSPMPKYFEFNRGIISDLNGAYIPFSLTPILEKMGDYGHCLIPPSDERFETLLAADCNWLHHWVALPTLKHRDTYLEMLNNYSMEQRRYGRFQADFSNRIYNVNEWLERWDFLAKRLIMLIIVAFIFLFVCLINTNVLLFAKFSGKKGDISIKRALGANKNRIFRQYLVEVCLIGLLGGVLGIALTVVGLSGVIFLFEYFKNIAQLNLELVAMIVLCSIVSTMAAGFYPAWKVCQLPPAQYLKSQ